MTVNNRGGVIGVNSYRQLGLSPRNNLDARLNELAMHMSPSNILLMNLCVKQYDEIILEAIVIEKKWFDYPKQAN
jgi:hypothetical protein